MQFSPPDLSTSTTPHKGLLSGITAPSLADLHPKKVSSGELHEGVLPPQARDLYLDMRSHLMEQSEKFFEKHAILESGSAMGQYSGEKSKNANKMVLYFEQF